MRGGKRKIMRRRSHFCVAPLSGGFPLIVRDAAQTNRAGQRRRAGGEGCGATGVPPATAVILVAGGEYTTRG